MSILIKGMEMPKGCSDCDWWGNCNAMEDTDEVIDEDCERYAGCPLVEVPTPHGRLVEFIDVVVTDDEDTGTQEINLGEVLSAYLKMRSAPTVIEAEVEE